MNIGIDGYEANVEKRVGIGQYAYQLLCAINRLDQKNNYTIFLPQKPLDDLPPQSANWRYIVGNPGSLWTIRQLPKLIAGNPLNLFFSPTHYIPWFVRLPRIVSIMDLSFLHFPQMFRFKDRLQLTQLTAFSVKRAQKILTISQFSKQEIVDNFHIRPEKITVTYPGVTVSTLKQSEVTQKKILARNGVGENYILFVGTIQPRKNIERLISAFEEITDGSVQFVLVGKKGWLFEPILERISHSSKKQLIKWLDFVPDADLPVLYANATCFVLPSLYEGFGLPVVEAMHYGCPVVVSSTSSLPEIAGKAGIYVNPEDVDDIAQGLIKAIQLTPSERKKYVALGRDQVKKFTWEQCAKQTLKVFNEYE
ncbi:glycosyltransferase family 1 protein [Candidatus Microgenomates bacterium]|nr:MAG: glycosyltransferase family 1 protein [Candidatus Microgenomates bacterium]